MRGSARRRRFHYGRTDTTYEEVARDAELILVMDHGRIIETGNHKELLAKGGFYADLYNSQFTGASLEETRPA